MRSGILFLALCLLLVACDDHGDATANNTNNSNNTGNVNNAVATTRLDCDGARVYVAADGDDAAGGTEGEPFATLERARDAVRELLSQDATGVKVCVRGGVYPQFTTLQLGSEDSGTQESPVQWVGHPGEEVVITGGTALERSAFTAVDASDPNYDRLATGARDALLVLDLTAAGVTDLGTLERRGYRAHGTPSAMELYVDGDPMELARWPNRGQTDEVAADYPATVSGDVFGGGTTFDYLGDTATGNADDGYPNYHASVGGTDYYLYHCTWEWGGATHRYWFLSTADPRTDANCWPDSITSWIASGEEEIPVLGNYGGDAQEAVTALNTPVDRANGGFVRIPEALSATTFTFPGARSASWSEPDPQVQGLLGNYWADDTLSASFDAGIVTLAEEPAYGLNARQPFAVLNVLEELDVPGEYYIDRDNGLLYLYPPEGFASASRLEVSMTGEPLITVSSAVHLHFSGLTLRAGRGTLLEVSDSTGVQLGYLRLEGAGTSALTIEGSRSGLFRSTIASSGDMGVRLRCGDRSTLEEGECFVMDSEIRDFGRWNRTYSPAIRLEGCGNVALHNHLHSAPHAAILFTGNEHRIAYNDIGYVVLEANDAGAIYTGRDFGYRGNVIEHNYIHHVDSVFGGSHGVYLDDAVSGMTVRSNLLYAINGLATMSGGGRDNIFEYNVIVDARGGGHSTDRRAQAANNDNWSADTPDSWNLLGRLTVIFESYRHGTALDHRAGPWASRYPALALVPTAYADIEGSHWLDPEGSVFARNLLWRTETLLREGTWGGAGALECYADTGENLQDADPLFVDEAGGDLTLQSSSPAFSISGFVPIDFPSIGIRP